MIHNRFSEASPNGDAENETAAQEMQALDGGSGGQIGIAFQAETYRTEHSLASGWIARRYRLSPHIAAVVVHLAGFGGAA